MSVTFEQHLGLKLQERTQKPRKAGITMVIDRCEPWQYQQGYLDAFSDYIDAIKLTEPHLLQPLSVVQQKIDQLKRYRVTPQPGGIIIEMARAQGRGDEALAKLRDMGFEQIEVSSSANTQREMEEEGSTFARQRSWASMSSVRSEKNFRKAIRAGKATR
jgi:phosphosulfolactate synthase (CoM biosynthesis protein A)